MSSPTTIMVIGDLVVHTQPVQSEGAAAATPEVTFLNIIDETDPKGRRAQKRYLKLNHRNRRRKIQYKLPDQYDAYTPVWLKTEQKYYIDPTFPQGCRYESLDTYDLPQAYLQGDHWNYYGFTWVCGEFGPRKRKWGTKRYTKNFFCANVFGCECKHTKKQMQMKDIMDEHNRFIDI